MSDPKYVRVYYSICDDPKFVEVYPDNLLLATWLRLLLLADGVHPASAPIPRSVSPKALRRLAELHIIDVAGDHFRVHGLDAERARRAAAARIGGFASGNARRTTVERPLNDRSEVVPHAVRAQTNLDETRLDETRRADARDAAVALYDRTGRFPSPGLVKWLNRLTDRYGEARVTAAIDAAQPVNPTTPGDYLTAAEDDLRRTEYAAEKAEQADEQRRLREKRAPAPISPAVAQLRAAMLAREQGGDAA